MSKTKIPRATGIIVAIGAGMALWMVAGWIFLGGFERGKNRSVAFDPVAWRIHGGPISSPVGIKREDTVRVWMVDDLLRRYQFKGMTREEVVRLLGEPNTTSYFKNWDMVYWLGYQRGFMGLDYEWLVLRLDEGQKVTEYKIAWE